MKSKIPTHFLNNTQNKWIDFEKQYLDDMSLWCVSNIPINIGEIDRQINLMENKTLNKIIRLARNNYNWQYIVWFFTYEKQLSLIYNIPHTNSNETLNNIISLACNNYNWQYIVWFITYETQLSLMSNETEYAMKRGFQTFYNIHSIIEQFDMALINNNKTEMRILAFILMKITEKFPEEKLPKETNRNSLDIEWFYE